MGCHGGEGLLRPLFSAQLVPPALQGGASAGSLSWDPAVPPFDQYCGKTGSLQSETYISFDLAAFLETFEARKYEVEAPPLPTRSVLLLLVVASPY